MLVFFLLYLVCSLPDCTGLIASVTNIRTAVEAHECVLSGLVADAELAFLSCTRGGGEVVSGCRGAGSDDVTGFQYAKTTQRFVGTAYESPMSFERPTMTTPKGSRISMDYSTEPPTEIYDSFVLEKDDVFDTPRCIAAGLEDSLLVERFDIEPFPDFFQPNEQTLQGSFCSVSTPNFATKYSLESS